jgi:hypothetical protein
MYVEYIVDEKKNVPCRYIACLCRFVTMFLLVMLPEPRRKNQYANIQGE